MLLFSRIYWNIRYAFEKWYFETKYLERPNAIYYDRLFKCYVHPALIIERGSYDYVVSELTRTGLIYHYYIGEILEHSHSLEEVLKAAYEEAEKFKLFLEYGEYSEQEIKLVERIVEFRLKELGK